MSIWSNEINARRAAGREKFVTREARLSVIKSGTPRNWQPDGDPSWMIA
jgi:hypothetical protein